MTLPTSSGSSSLASLPPRLPAHALDGVPVFDMLDQLGFGSARPAATPLQSSSLSDPSPSHHHSDDRLSFVLGSSHQVHVDDQEDGDQDEGHDSADGDPADDRHAKPTSSSHAAQHRQQQHEAHDTGTTGEQTPDANQGGKDAAGNGDAKTSKSQKKRNRKPSSCAQCRKKKLRCDRQSPCGACILRGEPHLCSWEDAVPLLLGRTDNDASELKVQVDRLQSLVDFLCRKAPENVPTYANPSHPHAAYPMPYNTPSDAISDPAASVSGWSAPYRLPVAQAPPTMPGSVLGSTMSSHYAPSQRPPRPSHASACSAFEHSDDPGSELASDWSPTTETKHNLKGVDLAEALSHLAISHISSSNMMGALGVGDKPHHSDLISLEEAKKFVGLPAHFGLTDQPFEVLDDGREDGYHGPQDKDDHASLNGQKHMKMTLSGLSLGKGPSGGFQAIMDGLPTDHQAGSALSYYVKYVDWYFHVLHLPSFEKQLAAMRSKPLTEADPFFLATFLGIIGMGVAMQPAARALRDGFGTPAQRDATANKFLQAAMHALTLGRFLDKPSVEAIRAILICNTFFVFMDAGEQTGSGMGLLSLAIQIALQLGLHRDPDKTPGRYDPVQTESRRRLFWTLCSFECLASSALGRSYSVFNLDNVDTKFPRDLDDEEITPNGILQRADPSRETVMTSLIIRMKIGVVAKRISDKAFGIAPISYATVMELDRELRKQERDLPAHYQLRYDESTGVFALPAAGNHPTSLRFYMIHIALQMEYLRLHRPFLIKATSSTETAASRHICVRAARILLAIQRQPACQQNWGGLLYKSLSAAIVLSLDLLQEPYGQHVDLYRAEVRAILVTLNRYAATSSLCRKGVRVLGFLMEREQQLLQSHLDRTSKRARRSEASNLSVAGGITQIFSIAPMPVPDLATEPASEEEPKRKRSSAQKGNTQAPLYNNAVVRDATLSGQGTIDTPQQPPHSIPFQQASYEPTSSQAVNSTVDPSPHPRLSASSRSGPQDSIPAGDLPTEFHDHMMNLPPQPYNKDIPPRYHFDFTMVDQFAVPASSIPQTPFAGTTSITAEVGGGPDSTGGASLSQPQPTCIATSPLRPPPSQLDGSNYVPSVSAAQQAPAITYSSPERIQGSRILKVGGSGSSSDTVTFTSRAPAASSTSSPPPPPAQSCSSSPLPPTPSLSSPFVDKSTVGRGSTYSSLSWMSHCHQQQQQQTNQTHQALLAHNEAQRVGKAYASSHGHPSSCHPSLSQSQPPQPTMVHIQSAPSTLSSGSVRSSLTTSTTTTNGSNTRSRGSVNGTPQGHPLHPTSTLFMGGGGPSTSTSTCSTSASTSAPALALPPNLSRRQDGEASFGGVPQNEMNLGQHHHHIQHPHQHMTEWKDLEAYGLPTELEWQGVLGQGVLGKW